MKRTLSLLAVALLVGLLTVACKPTPTPGPPDTAVSAEQEQVDTPLPTPPPITPPMTQTTVPDLVSTLSPGAETATVIQVIDGDTIDVSMDGTAYRVRYIGINTPELDEPCGVEATAVNASLVEGQAVTMLKDMSETDQYGRLLRYIYVGEIFVNAQLVARGYAEAAAYPPDTSYADNFEGLEATARGEGWGCHPTGVFAGGEEVASPAVSPAVGGAACDCSGNLYNCTDFSTHADAQACFESCGGASNDVHLLDGDGDGIACEAMLGGAVGGGPTSQPPSIPTSPPVAPTSPQPAPAPTSQPAAPTSPPPAPTEPPAQVNPWPGCPNMNCPNFGSCGEVHQFLEFCPQWWSDLDRDHDGVPCEDLCG